MHIYKVHVLQVHVCCYSNHVNEQSAHTELISDFLAMIINKGHGNYSYLEVYGRYEVFLSLNN